MSTDTPKIQYQKEVEVRVESLGETRCMKPQKPKTKIKMVNQKKYKEIFRMNCLIGETQSKEVKTPTSHLMNFQWSREQKWNRVRVTTVHNTQDENNKVFLQKTCWYSRAQSGTFWWLDNRRSKSSQWRKWTAEQSSICSGGTRLGNTVDNHTDEVPGADEETKSHSHWQFFGIWQVLRGIILESLYVNTTQIRNTWDCRKSSAQSERRDVCGTVAIRSAWKMVGGFYGVLLPSATHSRSLVWWEITIWKAVRNAL